MHGKLRGRQNVIRWLAERALCGITDRNTPVRISHGDCLEDAQLLADLLAKGGVQADIRYVGTVIGSHTGPARAGDILLRQTAAVRKKIFRDEQSRPSGAGFLCPLKLSFRVQSISRAACGRSCPPHGRS